MANLHSVLILGPDAIAAASPANAVQLVHACHRWGFASVIPASWGDELLAAEVIRRCGGRENRPAIQCSCPRVAERLGTNAAKLDDTIFWLTTPPVAAAKYVRAHAPGDVHVTYAGSCPGAIDASIDQRMTPTELLLAISSRGIDVSAQPTVFENIIPPDRRRYFSAAGGVPDLQKLWESSAFRVAQPSDVDLSIGVAQLLLSEERVLIDMAPLVGCICRTEAPAVDGSAVLRSTTPIMRDGVVDVGRSAPAVPERLSDPRRAPLDSISREEPAEVAPSGAAPRRNSPARTVFRRQSAWRRQSPRSAMTIPRASAVIPSAPWAFAMLRRSDVRFALAAAVLLGALAIGMWMGRQMEPTAPGQAQPSAQRAGAPPGPRP